MLKSIKIILLLFIGTLAVSFIYYKYSGTIRGKNGFVRDFSQVRVMLQNTAMIESRNYSFANISRDSFSLYEYKKPYHILNFSTDLKRRSDQNLAPMTEIQKADGMNSVSLFGPKEIVVVGRASKAYSFDKESGKMDSTTLDSLYVYQAEIVSPTSFVYIREAYIQGERRSQIVKRNWGAKTIKIYVPEKQFDGIISTDGQFRIDQNSGSIIFMFYYRGELIRLDSNLKVLYKSKTIDTVTQANIRLRNLGFNTQKIATPPSVINKRICVANNKIFVQSNLISDFEDTKTFRSSDVIDIYDFTNGKYSSSFYLPKYGKQKLNEFMIDKGLLIAIYSNRVAVFKIRGI